MVTGVQERQVHVWLCPGCRSWSDRWFDSWHDANEDYNDHLVERHD